MLVRGPATAGPRRGSSSSSRRRRRPRTPGTTSRLDVVFSGLVPFGEEPLDRALLTDQAHVGHSGVVALAQGRRDRSCPRGFVSKLPVAPMGPRQSGLNAGGRTALFVSMKEGLVSSGRG